MATLQHISSSLRVLRQDGQRLVGVRTFSGVRHDLTQSDVSAFLQGFAALSAAVPSNAQLVSRAAFQAPAGP